MDESLYNIPSNQTLISESANDDYKTKLDQIKKLSENFAKLHVKPRIKLDHHANHKNINNWCFMIIAELQLYGLDVLVQNFKVDLSNEEQYKTLNLYTKTQLLLNIEEDLRSKLLEERHSFIIFSKIKSHYLGDASSKALKQIQVVSDMLNRKVDNLNYLTTNIRQAKELFENTADKDLLWRSIFLNCLSDKHNNLRSLLISTGDNKLEKYISIAEDEQNLYKQQQSTSAQLNNVNNRNKFNKNNRFNSSQQNKYNNTNNNKLNFMKCEECGKTNHNTEKCFIRIKRMNQQNSTTNNNNNNNNFRENKQYNSNNNHQNSNNNSNNNYNNNYQNSNNSNNQNYNNNNRFRQQHNNQQTNNQFKRARLNNLNEDYVEDENQFQNQNRERASNNCIAQSNMSTTDRIIAYSYITRNNYKENQYTTNQNNIYEIRNQNINNTDQINCNIYNIISKHDDHQIRYCLDSGATHHMINHQNNIINKRKYLSRIYTATDQYIDVDDACDLNLQTEYGIVKLENVLICTDLKCNFVSVKKLIKDGYRVKFYEHYAQIKLNKQALATFQNDESGLYVLNVNKGNDVQLNNIMNDTIDLHNCLGHSNYDHMNIIAKKLNIRLNRNAIQQCTTCIKSKIKRVPFPTNPIQSTKPFEIINTDLSGIIRIPNLLNYKYFLLFTDNFSRFTFVYLLKDKSEVADRFIHLYNQILNKYSLKINTIKSDCGTEYINNEINQFCHTQGIKQIYSTARCPQSNGLAERMNQTIEQLARSLLLSANLGTNFWPQAVNHAVFIKNRLPNSSINNQIPFEIIYNKEFNYSSLHAFGNPVIYLIDDRPLNKFEPKGEEGIFIGYPPEYDTFLIYSSNKRKFIIRKHVKFLVNQNINQTSITSNELDDKLFEYTENNIANRDQLKINELFFDNDEQLSSPVDNIQINSNNQSNQNLIQNQINNQVPNQQSSINNQQTNNNNQQINTDLIDLHDNSDFGNLLNNNLSNVNNESNYLNDNDNISFNDNQFNSNQFNNNQGDGNNSTILSESQQRLLNEIRNRPNGTNIVLNRSQFETVNTQNDITLQRLGPANVKQNGIYSRYKINFINQTTANCNNIINLENITPKNMNQLRQMPNNHLWKQAVDDELNSMYKNQAWIEVSRPQNKIILPTMWLFKIKTVNNQVDKYKARLVALGHLQPINESDNFAPVLNEFAIRILLAYACRFKMIIHHVDVCTAYLHAELNEEIYIERPAHYEFKYDRSKVYKLIKSIYGLRVAARCWFIKIRNILLSFGFIQLLSEENIFVLRISDEELIIIGVYVDDLMILASNDNLMIFSKNKLRELLDITDKGDIKEFLSCNIKYDIDRGILSIDQTNYIYNLLEQFNLQNCNGKSSPLPTDSILDRAHGTPLTDKSMYMCIVGRLVYLSTHGRWDIAFAVGRLCSFLSSPTDYHLNLAKHVLRYLKKTINYRIYYIPTGDELNVYCDSNFNNHDSKSITGNLTQLYNCIINWSSRKQTNVTVSTCEAEINSILSGVGDAIYVSEILNELNVVNNTKVTIYNDNQSSLRTLLSNGNFQANKHYRTKINFIRQRIDEHHFDLKYTSSKTNFADTLTKAVPGSRILTHNQQLNLRD